MDNRDTVGRDPTVTRTAFPHLDPPGEYTQPYRFVPDEEGRYFAFPPPPMSYQVSTRKRAAGGYPAGSKVVRRTAPATKSFIKRQVKVCMQRDAEHKHITTTDSATSSAGGTVGLAIPDLAQGTSNGTRIGSQITMHSIESIGEITLGGAAIGDQFRAILVMDHQPNGATFTVANVLETAQFNGLWNLDLVGNKVVGPGRFRILYDRMWDLSAPSAVITAGTGQTVRHFHVKIKLGMNAHYQSNAGTVSDLVHNNIAWLFISTNSLCAYSVRSQLCYTDV